MDNPNIPQPEDEPILTLAEILALAENDEHGSDWEDYADLLTDYNRPE